MIQSPFHISVLVPNVALKEILRQTLSVVCSVLNSSGRTGRLLSLVTVLCPEEVYLSGLSKLHEYYETPLKKCIFPTDKN